MASGRPSRRTDLDDGQSSGVGHLKGFVRTENTEKVIRMHAMLIYRPMDYEAASTLRGKSFHDRIGGKPKENRGCCH
jgi:hypothetical protein